MNNGDQILSGKVGIGKSIGRRHHLHLHHIGGSQEKGMNHNQENGNIGHGGKSGEYSLSDPLVFFGKNLAQSCFFFTYRHQRMSCTRREVKTERLVVRTERVAQPHIFLVSRTLDQRPCLASRA